MAPRTVHTNITISPDIYEILVEISNSYVSDRLTPIREANISGALQKAARLYIEAVKVANPELRSSIEAIEEKYATIRAVEVQEASKSNVRAFQPARRRGRPPKHLNTEGPQ